MALTNPSMRNSGHHSSYSTIFKWTSRVYARCKEQKFNVRLFCRICRGLWTMLKWQRGLGCRISRTGTGPFSRHQPSKGMGCLRDWIGCPTFWRHVEPRFLWWVSAGGRVHFDYFILLSVCSPNSSSDHWAGTVSASRELMVLLGFSQWLAVLRLLLYCNIVPFCRLSSSRIGIVWTTLFGPSYDNSVVFMTRTFSRESGFPTMHPCFCNL